MNKRMIELAKEADILEWEVLPWNKDARTPNHESAARVTKFAELIVRDAMDYASRNWEHGHLLAEDLKVYFGVE